MYILYTLFNIPYISSTHNILQPTFSPCIKNSLIVIVSRMLSLHIFPGPGWPYISFLHFSSHLLSILTCTTHTYHSPLAYIVYLILKYTQVFHSIQLTMCTDTFPPLDFYCITRISP